MRASSYICSRKQIHKNASTSPEHWTWPGKCGTKISGRACPQLAPPHRADGCTACKPHLSCYVRRARRRGWRPRTFITTFKTWLCMCVLYILHVHAAYKKSPHTRAGKHKLRRTPLQCVLLCFIKPILGNRYVRSRGFIMSEPKTNYFQSYFSRHNQHFSPLFICLCPLMLFEFACDFCIRMMCLGEVTTAQTGTAEHSSSLWTEWLVSIVPPSPFFTLNGTVTPATFRKAFQPITEMRMKWRVLELYLRRDFEHNVTSSLPTPLF